MHPSDLIEGPTQPAYLFIESRRTKHPGAMTVAELTAVCAVLEFDRWLHDEDVRGRNIVRKMYLQLVRLPSDGGYWIGDLVISDFATEALLRITDYDGSGALRTARGERKIYKTIETAIGDAKRILSDSANDKDRICVTFSVDDGV